MREQMDPSMGPCTSMKLKRVIVEVDSEYRREENMREIDIGDNINDTVSV